MSDRDNLRARVAELWRDIRPICEDGRQSARQKSARIQRNTIVIKVNEGSSRALESAMQNSRGHDRAIEAMLAMVLAELAEVKRELQAIREHLERT